MTALPAFSRRDPRYCARCDSFSATERMAVEHREIHAHGDFTEARVFDFPLPPNISNQAPHFAERSREHQAFVAACDARLCSFGPPEGKFPFPPRSPLEHARMTAVLRTSRAMDSENAEFRAYKWPTDWLVLRRYLRDDRPSIVERVPVVQQRCRRAEAGVTITVVSAPWLAAPTDPAALPPVAAPEGR